MLQITDLTLRIAGRPLLEGASLTLPDGAKAGFVGRNGSGKTTLFRAIAGEIAPDQGSISLPKGTRIGCVEQEAPSGPATLIETVLAADRERAALLSETERASDPHRIAELHARLTDIDAHSAEARAARILAGLGFDADAQARPCSEFSGGWRMRVALAGLLFAEPDLLLLDEPTNYLDLEGTLWLERFLARYPRTVIVISHDRDLLNTAVDSIVHLIERKLTYWRGGYDSFETQYRERQALQEKQRIKQVAERKHMQAFVDRFRYKASKARQAQSRLKAIARLQPIAEISEEHVTPFRFPEPERTLSPPIIRLEGVSVGYRPGEPVLSHLDLRIDNDDRIALLGKNGNGKSTFAKLLAGALQPETGSVVRASKLKIGLFAQHQLESLRPEWSAYEHVRALMPVAQAKVRAHRADGPRHGERWQPPPVFQAARRRG
jgi:ATP-binding cassette subfamily F protein 3